MEPSIGRQFWVECQRQSFAIKNADWLFIKTGDRFTLNATGFESGGPDEHTRISAGIQRRRGLTDWERTVIETVDVCVVLALGVSFRDW